MKDFMGVPPLEAHKKIKLESNWISSLTRVVVNHTEKEEVDERVVHQQQRSVQACDCLCEGHYERRRKHLNHTKFVSCDNWFDASTV